MKFKYVFVLGIIAAFLVVSVTAPIAHADGGIRIIHPPDNPQFCPHGAEGVVCDAGDNGENCPQCCNFYGWIIDLYGCDCCEPPGGIE